MVRLQTLRGYLLEEVLAWLLRSSGYRLLTEKDDPARPPWKVLEQRTHGLVVRGRGAWHQADSLGEFQYVPPFSLPIRLFAEAKFIRAKVGLPTVRNGHGVVHDLNENVVTTLVNGSGPHRPRVRYHYSYAIFSASGFTQDAQEFALAHQISLIDLSLPDFQPLLDLVRTAAESVYNAMAPMPPSQRPTVYKIRNYLRRHLLNLWDGPAANASSVTDPLDTLAAGLRRRSSLGLVLAFPAAPFVLGLVSDDLRAFVRHSLEQPTHAVRVHRSHRSVGHPVWLIEPREGHAYRLTFSLPEQVESWILDQEEGTRSRTRWMTRNLLSAITMYWVDENHTHTFQLQYSSEEFREVSGRPGPSFSDFGETTDLF
ncbi:hypothetical protein EDD90_7643 [Streptomyces sp. Ag109_O5-1]|uniref:restriction endonuclease n=1 Tax=Streptomyces sp. Ag109_O5-1 TaxID=1938851 RepID=UPI000FA42225|nr:restriction endonuclease [Streptomyces sp. Ag109_O5-1]RPE44403.1 hypothetical protein EDD90_7643 [Streptomyces sp. Ag109_O5-1]